jgi:Protein of unknown function (DUF1573)
MKSYFLIPAFSVLAFVGCKNDATPATGAAATDAVNTVQKPAGEAAAIVHNDVSASVPSDTVNVAKIEFETTEYNFGEVKEGAVVKHSFKFKNTGRVPLLISNAQASCGCTVPEWPKEAIPVGGSSEITAKFNTEGKQNQQTKNITITANTYPGTSQVSVTGFVKPKKS